MKAFLSHSSRDKAFVEQVFDALGAAQAHYDAATFEKAVLNVEAIKRAIQDSQVFVLFLSSNSLESNFVTHESQSAFERLAAGDLRKILIICIDETSLTRVPQFLKDRNIVTTILSPGACIRRIQALLTDLSVEDSRIPGVFVGRETEISQLKEALAKPSSESPAVVVLTGHGGIGRRTLLTKVMGELLPRFKNFLMFDLPGQAGVDDFFVALLRGRGRATIQELTTEIDRFFTLDDTSKIDTLRAEISRIIGEGDTLMISDAGGLVQEDGSYPPYLLSAFEPWLSFFRPIAFLIQQRMTPNRFRAQYNGFHFERVAPFQLKETLALVGSKLKAAGIEFDARDQQALAKLVDGHPTNVDFAIAQIRASGGNTKLFLSDPTDLVMWKNRRASDYISQLDFSELESRIVSLLLAFRFLPTELLISLCPQSTQTPADAIRRMQDWNVIEFHSGVLSISLPLLDALERSEKFRLTIAEEKRAASTLLAIVESYENEESVPVALVEPAMIAAIRAEKSGAQSQWRQLVLPSHYLGIAREAYNRADYDAATMFCERALERSARMTFDAKVEAWRFIGLSAIRRRDQQKSQEAIDQIGMIRTRHAQQTRFFLEGFSRRYAGDILGAEASYLKCFDKKEKNFSVCRELAQIYLSLGRYSEAETYARTAYAIAPTNPYVVDIMVGVRIGEAKNVADLKDDREFLALLKELQRYGDGDGKSFYSRRQAELSLRQGNLLEAKRWSDKAVQQTPHLMPPYLIRAAIQIKRAQWDSAEWDITTLKRLAGEDGEAGGQFVVELFQIELGMIIGRKAYRQAHNLIERLPIGRVPHYLEAKFKKDLALAIAYDKNFYDADLKAWAAQVLK